MPPRHWQSRHHPFSILLRPIAWLYGWLWSIRSKLYAARLLKTHKLPVPVIVVGNVVAGGVGKTPIVMALVDRLQSQGLHPGVISRGYGRKSKLCLEVSETSTATEVGDEPLLIHHVCRVPVVVASNRVLAARTLLAKYPNCNLLVSDDGLQHRALDRDIEIVVFDDRGTGNGAFLPAGPLREPWPRTATCPTHLVLKNVTRHLDTYASDAKGKRYKIDDLKKIKLYALAGIAKPESFFQMLRDQGLQLASTTAYADHHLLAKVKMPKDGLLICTEKDAVKLWPLHPGVLSIKLVVELDATFLTVFDATINALVTP